MKLNKKNIKVAIVMGSNTDYPVMKECEKILKTLNIKFESKIVSAHRTPQRMYSFAKSAWNDSLINYIASFRSSN